MFKQVIAKIFGDVAHGTTDAGDPVKIGLQARRTNPTAVQDADRVNALADDVGRQLIWPYQVRDLAATAQATLSNGASTALLAAGGSGVFHDLMHITMANNSTVAASVTLKDDGTVAKTFQVPASSTIAIDFTYPLLQGTANGGWNADMEDITGTTVTVDATFIKNV